MNLQNGNAVEVALRLFVLRFWPADVPVFADDEPRPTPIGQVRHGPLHHDEEAIFESGQIIDVDE